MQGAKARIRGRPPARCPPTVEGGRISASPESLEEDVEEKGGMRWTAVAEDTKPMRRRKRTRAAGKREAACVDEGELLWLRGRPCR